jgi:hypothetical protein
MVCAAGERIERDSTALISSPHNNNHDMAYPLGPVGAAVAAVAAIVAVVALLSITMRNIVCDRLMKNQSTVFLFVCVFASRARTGISSRRTCP